MRKLASLRVGLILGGLLASGCTGGGVFGTNNTTVGNPVFNPTTAVMQLSVGTINDPSGTFNFVATGAEFSNPGTWINAVATFRSQNGTSAFLNPGKATLARPNGLTTRTIGSVFAYGGGLFVNQINGLPPAFPGTFPTGFLLRTSGTFSGRNVIGSMTLASGTYTLNTTVSQNGVPTPYMAQATLPVSPRILGAWLGPPVWTPDLAHDGGGFFAIPAAPAFVTESVVVVENVCNVSFNGLVEAATAETTTTTATNVTLPPGTLSPVCADGVTPASYQAFLVGADWPWFESAPPGNTSQTPIIGGSSSGTANFTVSAFSSSFGT